LTELDLETRSELVEARSSTGPERKSPPEAAWKTVLLDAGSGKPVIPNGSMGLRYANSGAGRWNLDLEGITPALSIRDVDDDEVVEVLLPCFQAADGSGSVLRRGVPVVRIGDHLVTTVFDLLLAQHGVARPDLPGEWPTGYNDPTAPYTPAWQAEITSVPAEACIRIAREFASNSEQSNGRPMIIMGAGICQWFHADATYRSILSLLILTGCMGRNGGGWAHYVGQEKCWPITGWISLANALDWSRPPRTMIGTA
jgi:nitrate reductase / nitrite oxidoreductase, alpha subunit